MTSAPNHTSHAPLSGSFYRQQAASGGRVARPGGQSGAFAAPSEPAARASTGRLLTASDSLEAIRGSPHARGVGHSYELRWAVCRGSSEESLPREIARVRPTGEGRDVGGAGEIRGSDALVCTERRALPSACLLVRIESSQPRPGPGTGGVLERAAGGATLISTTSGDDSVGCSTYELEQLTGGGCRDHTPDVRQHRDVYTSTAQSSIRDNPV